MAIAMQFYIMTLFSCLFDVLQVFFVRLAFFLAMWFIVLNPQQHWLFFLEH